MRITTVTLSLLLAAPALSVAQDRPPRPPSPSPSSASSQTSRPDATDSSAARPPRPPPPATSPTSSSAPPRPPGPGDSGRPPPPGPGPGGGPGWAAPPPVYYPPPFWAGFGWGWGYYPLYPVYTEVTPGYAVPAAPPTHQVASTLRATGAFGSGDTGMVGMAFAVDTRGAGFNMGFDAFDPSSGGVLAGTSGSSSSYGFGTIHFAYPLLEGAAYRLRLEAGGSWLTVPSSSWGSATDAFGFDLGASANLGLFGPLGFEGHARITPYPVQVVDLRAAAALRGGPLSVTFGYRVIDVAQDTRTGPAARFEGPEIGMGLIF
jgi:hypothetical protein